MDTMKKYMKDRYFWYIVTLAFPVIIFTYAADFTSLTGLVTSQGWEPTYYVSFQRFFFIVCASIAAWKFGIKWGLVTCLILGPVIISHYIVSPERYDILLQVIVILIGAMSSWLVGRQGKLKRLLEESSEELKRQAEKLNLEINERKRAEETLRESEKRYRLLAENATDVIWTVDINNPALLTYISPSINRLLGYSVEEAMVKSIKEIFTPESLEVITKAFDEEMTIKWMGLSDTFRSSTLEVDLYHKDGSIVPVEVNHSYIRDSDGKAKSILVIARDISERKQMEEQLIMTDRLASIGELASGLAHELNNPLTSVIGFSELLMEEEIPDKY